MSTMPSEKDKMLAGQLYLPQDETLRREHMQAKLLFKAYNDSSPEAGQERRALLSRLLGGMGQKIEIEPPFMCDYGYNLVVGENFFANYGLVVLDCAKVTIGDNVLLGPGVHIYTAEHPLDPAIRRQGLESARPVSIGNDVWIGGGVIIQAGVTIGSGSTIGAGSIVTRDIPENVLAMGCPARVVRTIE